MTNRPITVDGKQYTVAEETTYTMEPGKVYMDKDRLLTSLCGRGDTQRIIGGYWQNATVTFPLRELIPVSEKQWREIFPEKYWVALGHCGHRNAVGHLNDYINEALQVNHLRVHNVDGSVSDHYQNKDGDWEYRLNEITWTCSTLGMAERLQTAFMRGSKVEVQG